MSTPRVSIITICYNSRHIIASTIRSVLRQRFVDFEYIIIDGKSNDGTKEVIERVIKEFPESSVKVSFISEPDSGIYNAMNKGLKLVKGEWVNFMNAGDCFHNDEVLTEVFSRSDFAGIDILCGVAEIKTNGKVTYWHPDSLKTMWRKMPFCHQSVFIRASVHTKRLFDEGLRLSSDYKFFLISYLRGNSFAYISNCVANYDTSGQSVTNEILSVHENIRIALQLRQVKSVLYFSIVYLYRTTLKKIIRYLRSRKAQ